MGATPANVATKLETSGTESGLHPRVIVLAGLNLPMLMSCISHREDDLETLALKALQGGQNGILRLGNKVTKEKTQEQT
jgi:PTS system ascorbate-specific IIA component